MHWIVFVPPRSEGNASYGELHTEYGHLQLSSEREHYEYCQLSDSRPNLYEYDHSGRLAEVTGTNGQKSYYMYDEAGQVKKVYTDDGSKAYTSYYDYNEVGLVSRMRQENAAGTLLMDDTFLYDANGNRTQITHLDGTKEVFAYDVSNRLTREQTFDAAGAVTSDISYEYDVRGNRLSRTVGTTKTTYDYHKANQLISMNGTALTYDSNGNTLSVMHPLVKTPKLKI
jgi:YD repeat-containing protein